MEEDFVVGKIERLSQKEFDNNCLILKSISAVHCANCGNKLARFPYAKIETTIPLGATIIFVEPCKNCLGKE